MSLQSFVASAHLLDSQKFIHAVQSRKKDIGNGTVRYHNLRG